MKINVFHIISQHIATLYNADSRRISIFDFFLFYVVPVFVGFLLFYSGVKIKSDAFNVSITFFGIFIALLLNIQVAIFAIYQRKWTEPEDKTLSIIQKDEIEDRRNLLGELNTNISYLIVFCSIALVIFLILFVLDIANNLTAAITFGLYCHFVLTFLMIIKRSHALFQKEYNG